MCLLCAITASAVSYASPYKGAGSNGYIRPSSSYVHHASVGLAQTPVASMSSTSRGMATTAMVSSNQQVSGFRTSASSIQGGVTTQGKHKSSARKSTPLPPGACPNCPWEYDPATDTWYCPYCDCDPYDECDHECVPISFGKDVWLLMVALVGVYSLYKIRKKKGTI